MIKQQKQKNEMQKIEKQIRGKRDYLDQSDEASPGGFELEEVDEKTEGEGFRPRDAKRKVKKLKWKWIDVRV